MIDSMKCDQLHQRFIFMARSLLQNKSMTKTPMIGIFDVMTGNRPKMQPKLI
jgi:hypothetical protein